MPAATFGQVLDAVRQNGALSESVVRLLRAIEVFGHNIHSGMEWLIRLRSAQQRLTSYLQAVPPLFKFSFGRLVYPMGSNCFTGRV